MPPAPRLAVVIPAALRDDAADTAASVLAYGGDHTSVVVVDDTGGALAHLAGERVHVRPALPGKPGVGGALWAKLADAYGWALDTLEPDIVMKLDADALMIGPGLAEAAGARFAADPALGMLGSYAVGPDGGRRDWSPAAVAIRAEAGWRGLRSPRHRRLVRALLREARAHGYVDGEHVLGAACLMSAPALRAVRARGWLEPALFQECRLVEDWIFPLEVVAAGFRVADFGGPGDPLGVRWRGLPGTPESLRAEGRLVVHSVRDHGDAREADIRAAFARMRADDAR